MEVHSSGWTNVIQGVPRGFILSPLLFLIFINDLPEAVKNSDVNLFADDAAIFCSDTDPLMVKSKIEEDLVLLKKWIYDNGLQLHVAKSQLLIISSSVKMLEW